VLGGGPAARLFLNLREEKGYTYGVYSNFTAVRYAGAWAGAGDVRRDVTEGALHEFVYEFTRLGKEPVPEAELDDARRSVVAGFALSLEQPERLIGYAMDRAIYRLPEDYWDTYPAKISAVTAADVTRVAAKYLDPEKLQIVGVGEAKAVLPAFERYGAVKLYDTQGKPENPAPGEGISSPQGESARESAPVVGGVVAPDQSPAPPPQPNKPTRIRVAGRVMEAKLIHKVTPSYPPEARNAGITGTVLLKLIVSKDGTIQQLQFVSGDSTLARAALDAVRQWRYKPTLLNGDPVEVETNVEVVFSLQTQ
jgi:TonB family protein